MPLATFRRNNRANDASDFGFSLAPWRETRVATGSLSAHPQGRGQWVLWFACCKLCEAQPGQNLAEHHKVWRMRLQSWTGPEGTCGPTCAPPPRARPLSPGTTSRSRGRGLTQLRRRSARPLCGRSRRPRARLPSGPSTALPTSDPPHAFTPLAWEALGRIGPATDAWLNAALAGPHLAAVRAALLLHVSVALWPSLKWAVAGGYAACSTPEHVPAPTADSSSPAANDWA